MKPEKTPQDKEAGATEAPQEEGKKGDAREGTIPDPSVFALPKGPAIAVLPFTNMRGNPDDEFFTDGMTEDIITGLARFTNLFVIARNSTFRFKGQGVNVRAVGRELGARYVLEGAIRRSAGQLRVSSQLIDASTGTHLCLPR